MSYCYRQAGSAAADDITLVRLLAADLTFVSVMPIESMSAGLYEIKEDGTITYRLRTQVPQEPVITITVFIFDDFEAGCRKADGVFVPLIVYTVVILVIITIMGEGKLDPLSSERPVLTSSLLGIGVPPVLLVKPSAVLFRYRL